MNSYAKCLEYLLDLGLPREVCERICKRYEEKDDLSGLLDYILVCEAMVDSCVD